LLSAPGLDVDPCLCAGYIGDAGNVVPTACGGNLTLLTDHPLNILETYTRVSFEESNAKALSCGSTENALTLH